MQGVPTYTVKREGGEKGAQRDRRGKEVELEGGSWRSPTSLLSSLLT
jgi:hypothetical protein